MDLCKKPRENVRILDPEIYIPPRVWQFKSKGGSIVSLHITGYAQPLKGTLNKVH
jgi:hypothetical protein